MVLIRKQAVAACLAALFVSSAGAATQTLSSTAFDITYDDSVIGLFGAPTLLGNNLFFNPGGSPGFTAQTDSGIKVTNSTFAFTITANPGFLLTSFDLLEEGDYFHFGGVSGVAASGQLRVKPLDPISATMTDGLSASAFVANPMLDFTTNNWTADASITASPFTIGHVSIQNILAAFATGELAYAFIEKKNVSLAVGVTAVPEPHTYALMLAGIGMLGFAARKRMSQGD